MCGTIIEIVYLGYISSRHNVGVVGSGRHVGPSGRKKNPAKKGNKRERKITRNYSFGCAIQISWKCAKDFNIYTRFYYILRMRGGTRSVDDCNDKEMGKMANWKFELFHIACRYEFYLVYLTYWRNFETKCTSLITALYKNTWWRSIIKMLGGGGKRTNNSEWGFGLIKCGTQLRD